MSWLIRSSIVRRASGFVCYQLCFRFSGANIPSRFTDGKGMRWLLRRRHFAVVYTAENSYMATCINLHHQMEPRGRGWRWSIENSKSLCSRVNFAKVDAPLT